MTAAHEAVPDEAVPAGPDAVSSEGETRRRAKSVPTALPSALSDTLTGHAPSSPEQAAERTRQYLASLLTGHSVLNLDPPSIRTTWAAHRKAAAHWEAALVRYPRLAYGLAHTTACAVIYLLLWACSTPAGLLVTAGSVTACWFWL